MQRDSIANCPGNERQDAGNARKHNDLNAAPKITTLEQEWNKHQEENGQKHRCFRTEESADSQNEAEKKSEGGQLRPKTKCRCQTRKVSSAKFEKDKADQGERDRGEEKSKRLGQRHSHVVRSEGAKRRKPKRDAERPPRFAGGGAGANEQTSEAGDYEAGQQIHGDLAEHDPEPRVGPRPAGNSIDKSKIGGVAGHAHIYGNDLAGHFHTVNSVFEPVPGEFFVEDGVPGGLGILKQEKKPQAETCR
ncbi:MAG TPA: hypothetical protein VLX60_11365 [Terriglobales bacterium]|nr:hypothetical protein [Terriglobales bacterium]